MPLIAIISRPDLQLASWQTIAEQHPDLARRPPQEWRNPFRGRMEMRVFPPTDVEVTIDGEVLGGIVPSSWFEDDHELLVFANPAEDPRLAACAQRVADLLGATLEWVGPDHPQRGRSQ